MKGADPKDAKGLDKKDPNSKSIGKLDKSGGAEKPKNQKGGKEPLNKHVEKEPPKGINIDTKPS